MRHSDFAYANDIRAAVELRTPRTARMLLVTTLILLICAIIWAHFAVLDEVKRGQGRVIPSQQTQVVQSLEGGIVDEILVQEGAIVKKDQPLMRINDTKFLSELGEVRERRNAIAARVIRLEAEVAGNDKLSFPAELAKSSPRSVAAEKSLFEARMRKLAQDIDVLTQQEKKLNASVKLLDREVELTQKLHARKIVPEIEMLRLQRQSTDMHGQLAETKSKVANIGATFRSTAEEDLAKSRADLAVLDEKIKSSRDRVRRTELKSPVYGIVNKLNVTTIGAVVQPGADLMDIVPLDDTLLVEGRIRPQDIAFVRPGQEANVKITAYDSSVYGSLKGRVERLSADTIVENANNRGGPDKQETFYRVMVRTDKNYLGTTDNKLPIIPGMVATVEVLTGKKTVLDYLVKPARLLRQEALREH